MSGTEIAYAATRTPPSPHPTSQVASCLRLCYTMPGTDIANAAICLRTRYAVSGADIAYAATRLAYQHERNARK
eukprot:3127297-Rhodomonas_salina.1